MKSYHLLAAVIGCVALLTGCAGYQRGSAVARELRTIHIPAFENYTEYPMVGASATQQFLDAVIEDGTFTPMSFETARLRTQVIIKSCSTDSVRYDRDNLIVPDEYYLTLTAELYIFDAKTGETYVDGKKIIATDTMLTRNHYQTGINDAIPRVARRLARNLLDELQSIEQK